MNTVVNRLREVKVLANTSNFFRNLEEKQAVEILYKNLCQAKEASEMAGHK